MENNLQQMSAVSMLALFDTNKEQRISFVRNVVTQMEDGITDPLLVHLFVKNMEKILDGLTNTDEKKNKDLALDAKRYKELVLDAASKFGSKDFEFHNAKIKIGEVGSTFNYDQCGDTELAEWQSQFDALKEKIDARKKMLQTVSPKGMTIVTEQGEGITVYAPSKKSTTSVICTLQ